MTPIFELRGAIPLKLIFNMPLWQVYALSVAGNIIPALFLLLWLDPVSSWLMARSKMAERFFRWLFARTRRRSRTVERYGAIGLSLFVAIPLPVTGAWTGCVAAFLFGIRFRYALPAVIAGVMIAGVVVSILTFGADMALKSF
ncbi:TPA: ligand-binding protein SH3 [Candidatus Poribacteria bacterium]|nr:ligand-binding protein SH3 [Candidatus Poribacteria bacterium]